MAAAFKCDGCGKFAAANKETACRPFRSLGLPLGWLRVYVEDRATDSTASDQDGSGAEVCSRACGATWLAGFES